MRLKVFDEDGSAFRIEDGSIMGLNSIYASPPWSPRKPHVARD